MSTAGGGAPSQLRIRLPANLRGMTLQVRDGRSIVGRATASQIHIDHPDVSRAHAAVVHRPGRTTVEDLGSRNGTVVNGNPADQPCELHHGDQVRFGSVVTVFEDLAGPEPATGVFDTAQAAGGSGPGPGAQAPDPGGAPRFDVDEQRAEWISNVGGDQYVMAQRESFLREIAAARTRARRVVLFGFLIFLAGLAGQAWFMLSFSQEWQQAWDSFGQQDLESGSPDMPEVAIGVAVVSALAVMLGILVMLVGLVLHVSATARRRRVDDQQRLLGPRGPWPAAAAPYSDPGGARGFQHRQPAGRRHQQRRR